MHQSLISGQTKPLCEHIFQSLHDVCRESATRTELEPLEERRLDRDIFQVHALVFGHDCCLLRSSLALFLGIAIIPQWQSASSAQTTDPVAQAMGSPQLTLLPLPPSCVSFQSEYFQGPLRALHPPPKWSATCKTSQKVMGGNKAGAPVAGIQSAMVRSSRIAKARGKRMVKPRWYCQMS